MIKKRTAIGVFSGGLDSLLSAILIQRQDFDVYLLHFVSPYFGYKGEKLLEIKNEMEKRCFHFIAYEFGQDYIESVIKKPKHRIGSSMNYCVDCHRYMFSVAKQKMKELGAEFVFSGEVLAQRPMSQNKMALKLVEKESGLTGFLVRPLSAKVLDPTIPEEKGILDRSKLMNISGRGRARQVALAKEFGIEKYPQPAGGCKFTDPNLKIKFLTLKKVNKNLCWDDLKLLISSRCFLLDDNAMFIVSRDEKESVHILNNYPDDIILEAGGNIPSAAGILRAFKSGEKIQVDFNSAYIEQAGRTIARYSKGATMGKNKTPVYYFKNKEKVFEKEFEPFTEEELKKYRL